jgi:hypothetical protein
MVDSYLMNTRSGKVSERVKTIEECSKIIVGDIELM